MKILYTTRQPQGNILVWCERDGIEFGYQFDAEGLKQTYGLELPAPEEVKAAARQFAEKSNETQQPTDAQPAQTA